MAAGAGGAQHEPALAAAAAGSGGQQPPAPVCSEGGAQQLPLVAAAGGAQHPAEGAGGAQQSEGVAAEGAAAAAGGGQQPEEGSQQPPPPPPCCCRREAAASARACSVLSGLPSNWPRCDARSPVTEKCDACREGEGGIFSLKCRNGKVRTQEGEMQLERMDAMTQIGEDGGRQNTISDICGLLSSSLNGGTSTREGPPQAHFHCAPPASCVSKRMAAVLLSQTPPAHVIGGAHSAANAGHQLEPLPSLTSQLPERMAAVLPSTWTGAPLASLQQKVSRARRALRLRTHAHSPPGRVKGLRSHAGRTYTRCGGRGCAFCAPCVVIQGVLQRTARQRAEVRGTLPVVFGGILEGCARHFEQPGQ